MTSIDLTNVNMEFPVYTAVGRSIRAAMLRRIGGRIQEGSEPGRLVVRALRNINLSLRPGDRLGLIGPNGAGKSTLLRLLSGVYEPPIGSIRVNGKVSSMLDVMLGIDHELNGYDNIILRGVLLGMSMAEARALTPEIAEFSELGEFLQLPVRTYSAGMMLRLAFAISTATQPDIVLLDEVIGVGDAAFSVKAKARLQEMVNNAAILVLASHDHTVLGLFCNQIAVLHAGEIVDIGESSEVLARYETSMATGGSIQRGAEVASTV
jgi:ABC-2 type transport system ATP-binding protein/lipopolysaccharide transport system ATP-binding protein